MRIALLGSERTGSTTLFYLIKEHLDSLNYTSHCEPFNQYLHELKNRNVYLPSFYENKNNVFIKTFLNDVHRPKGFINNDEMYWDWFFNYFEKIILLDRKDKTLQSESFIYHAIKGTKGDWHKRQYYDFSGIEEKEIEYRKNILIEESEKLHKLTEKGYPIFYFEDIYTDRNKSVVKDILRYVGVELNDDLYNKFVLADKNRVRLNKGESPHAYLI